MISTMMQTAMNNQVNAEMYSAYLYLSMAAYFEDQNLNGMAAWMKAQAQEEMLHAMKFYSYIFERGGRVTLQAIEAPATQWDSPLAAFQDAYAHEQKVTALINGLVDIAEKEKDRASFSFLTWFVDEQVEEECSVDTVVKQLKILSGAPHALFMLDRELGTRVFTPPPADGQSE